ncbi:MAG: phage terminase large subunit [Acidithiobacillus ferriphilus]
MAAAVNGFALTPRQKEANRLLTGPQRHTLLVGGSRSGKTFLLVRALLIRALKHPSRHAIFRLRYNALKASIVMDTLPKVMALCFPGVVIKLNRNDGYGTLPNGSEIWFAGLDEKERVEKILGMEFATLYFNECSQIPYDSVLTAMSRLAQRVDGLRNRAYYDLNPSGTGHWTYKIFIEGKDPRTGQPLFAPDNYASMYLNPVDNTDNIDPDYIAALMALPEKQRRRFLDGKYIAEIDNALWTMDLIERQRITPDQLPMLQRVLVAVDPSGCSGPENYRSDEIGISACGLGIDGCGYVLADRTGRYSPETWARLSVETWREFCGDKIVAEKNFGGDMVRAVIQGYDRNVPVEVVTATRGKILRAEPIAGLYESGRIYHVGHFDKLEDQMANFSSAGYLGDRSPDAADAAVHALTALMLGQVTAPLVFGGLPI